MMVIVFRSRFRKDRVPGEYEQRADEIFEIGSRMPGYVSLKSFTAEDGERLTLVEFDNEEHLADWRRHSEHVVAQQEGRDKFYSEYTLQVCKEVRRSEFGG